METKTLKFSLKSYRVKILNEVVTPYDAYPICNTPEAGANQLREIMTNDPAFRSDVENLIVLFLDPRRRVKGYEIVSQGTLDTLLVHPRNVFRSAIVANASAIIIAHNHPSGDPAPSEADVKVTRDLIHAGRLLKIDVLDHVVMGAPSQSSPKDYASLRELGYFYN